MVAKSVVSAAQSACEQQLPRSGLRRCTLLASAIVILNILTACAWGGQEAAIARGEKVFQDRCASCHTIISQGGGESADITKVGGQIDDRFRDGSYASTESTRKLKVFLVAYHENATDLEMEPKELDDLVEYLWTFKVRRN